MGDNLPILDSIIKDTDTRALYLFPTKAQDQVNELYQTIEALGEDIATFTYDGDTRRMRGRRFVRRRTSW